MGKLRERRRVAVPVIAALGGMVAPAVIYLAVNAAGRAWAHGAPPPARQAIRKGLR